MLCRWERSIGVFNESLVVLNKEGKYPQECEGDLETQRDNFTDALMLDIAGFDNGKSLIERAFGNYYIASDKSNPILWLQLEDLRSAAGNIVCKILAWVCGAFKGMFAVF